MYEEKKGGNAADEAAKGLERTAFRKAEKQYKLYKIPNSNRRSKQQQKNRYRHTDLSDVVDFDRVLRSHRQGEELPRGIFALDPSSFSFPVFCFRDRPGFFFIPGALSVDDQCHWVRESLTSFPQPPNRTNHTALYGPIHDLFLAAQSEMVMVEASLSESSLPTSKYTFCHSSDVEQDEGSCSIPIPATVLLRKLRWSTLGLQYDWSKRNYDIHLPHEKISDELYFLAKKMAAPAVPLGEEFHPEAAIVNYFGTSDALGGHLDDMEADWSKPIVSISLGCKAIFLLGGKSRDDVPVAMFVRSGDIVLMAGQARECFHGVPRIFTDDKCADAPLLLSKFSDEVDQAFAEYVKSSRINISIRQVS